MHTSLLPSKFRMNVRIMDANHNNRLLAEKRLVIKEEMPFLGIYLVPLFILLIYLSHLVLETIQLRLFLC